MKSLTSYQLVHILIKNKKDVSTIYAHQIFEVREGLRERNVICQIGGASFAELQADYPTHIHKREGEIRISDPDKLESILAKRLRFLEDDDLEKFILSIWHE